MRLLSIAVLALFASPAAAAPGSDSLPSRGEIDRASVAFSRMLDALLQIDVGPVADAVDPGRPRAGRRETFGDIARRDDPYFEQRMHRSVDALADRMAALSVRIRRMEPVLRRSLDEIERSVDDAAREIDREWDE